MFGIGGFDGAVAETSENLWLHLPLIEVNKQTKQPQTTPKKY